MWAGLRAEQVREAPLGQTHSEEKKEVSMSLSKRARGKERKGAGYSVLVRLHLI